MHKFQAIINVIVIVAVLISLHCSQTDADDRQCCYRPSKGDCASGWCCGDVAVDYLSKWCCGKGSCNIFCCNCDGGCLGEQERPYDENADKID